jgi:dTMP kinase
MKGRFITLEGPEGAGKSTQAKLLTDYLSSKGIEVVKTREPGGVSISEQLRDILLNPENMIFPRAELLLYASGRAQHTEELILPSLNEGKYVICERYIHASIAYQGFGRGLDISLIENLNEVASCGLNPDVTVVLDIDVEKGLKRVMSSNRSFDRLESENISFHIKVRRGYLELAKKNPQILVVDASSGEMEEIHAVVVRELEARGMI